MYVYVYVHMCTYTYTYTYTQRGPKTHDYALICSTYVSNIQICPTYQLRGPGRREDRVFFFEARVRPPGHMHIHLQIRKIKLKVTLTGI